ncbi:MAG: hypothetical protein Kow0098_26640 [Ignavibacteriaceae bacterium]
MRKLSDLKLLPAVLILFAVASCTRTKVIYKEKLYYDVPAELKNPKAKEKFFNHYSDFIKGKRIFLDPGHGGEDRRNIGSDSIVVEADVNLKVASYLREFLTDAGAIVFMSRYSDETVQLKKRSELANNSGAEIFISIHHNAASEANDNYTNYTSTYYHSVESDYNYEPCERDLARYVQRDLAYAMRNSGGPGSFDGTYSDYTLYPGEGLSVLRETIIPAVLVECGFHTHYIEERRLSLDYFNKIEAWGIFKGLCRYFEAGIPTIEKINTVNNYKEKNIELQYKLVDPYGINPESINIFWDLKEVQDFSFDPAGNILTVRIPDAGIGIHELRIIAANKNSNHSFPYHEEITIVRN